MPDAARFADEGADTFGHILEKTKTLNIPNLRRLGFLNLKCGGDMKGVESPEGASCGCGKRATEKIR